MGEAAPQPQGKPGVPFHRHYTGARSNQRRRERASAGSQVKDKITGANAPGIDQLKSQFRIS